jgi:hypothetical protein
MNEKYFVFIIPNNDSPFTSSMSFNFGAGNLRTFRLGLKNMEQPLGFPLSYTKSFMMLNT